METTSNILKFICIIPLRNKIENGELILADSWVVIVPVCVTMQERAPTQLSPRFRMLLPSVCRTKASQKVCMPINVLPSTKMKKVGIVGGGIVGNCLARILSEEKDVQTIIFERGGTGGGKEEAPLPGSTGLAPGFIGQFNTIDCLCILAQRTVEHYKSIPDGFAQVGGLEVAFTEKGLKELQERFELTQQNSKVKARWVNGEEACKFEPVLLSNKDEGQLRKILGGIFYPNDGTANAKLIARHEQKKAIETGAKVIYADVTVIEPGLIITKEGERFEVDDVVLCSGIWTKELLNHLPVYPVAHPYIYSEPHSDPIRKEAKAGSTPFIRWPEIHAYGRDHGPQYGFGSYNHIPILAETHMNKNEQQNKSANDPWVPLFTEILQTDGQKVLNKEVLKSFHLDGQYSVGSNIPPKRAFNGVFSVTPDLKPLAGLYDVKGTKRLFSCVAVWVTHAFGTAQLISKLILNKELDSEDATILKELKPDRFDSIEDETILRKQSLAMYNDIYARK